MMNDSGTLFEDCPLLPGQVALLPRGPFQGQFSTRFSTRRYFSVRYQPHHSSTHNPAHGWAVNYHDHPIRHTRRTYPTEPPHRRTNNDSHPRCDRQP